MIDQFTMQRLAFIRYGFQVAVDQSHQPEPMSAHSLLGFHDSVELFLQLAVEHLNIGKRIQQFMEYWGILDPELSPERLSQRAGMDRLNRARVSLKHHGNLPSNSQVEEFRAITSAFFEDNTPLIFGLGFDEISMVELVQHEGARDSLKQAEALPAERKTEAAMSGIAIAFDQLVRGVNEGYFERYHRSPFYFGEDFTFDKSFFRRSGVLPEDSKREQFEDKLTEAVESMQSAVQMLSLGIDYRRYAKFSLLTPVVNRALSGKYHVQVVKGLAGSIDWPPTVEACRFCLDFVVESSIRMRGTDITTLPDNSPTDRPDGS